MSLLPRRPSWLAFFAAVVFLVQGVGQASADEGEEEGWVTEEDKRVAGEAKVAVEVYCDGGFKGDVDREESRKILEDGVGGSNTLRGILTEAESQDDLSAKAQEKITPMWLFWRVGALVMSFFLVLLWAFCSWSACPCCKCCRCGARKRETNKLSKLILLVAGGALTFGVIFSAVYAMVGYSAAVDGFDNMACTSAKLLNATLSGRSDPNFIGLMPLLTVFQDLEDKLEADSTLMEDVRNVLDITVSITDAVTITAESLALLRDATGENFPPQVAANRHSCQLCEGISPALNAALGVVDSGIASKLSSARVEVKKQLGPSAAAALQDNFKKASKPLITVKTLFRNTFGFFTDTDKFLQIRGHLEGEGQPQTMKILTSIIIVISLAICSCMNVSLLSFTFFEKRGKAPEVDAPKPFSKLPHRSAGLTWCCGWLFAILAFLVGGLMTAISVPLSGMCLIMDDLGPQLLRDISPAVGMNLTGFQGNQTLTIIEKCLVPKDPTENAMLLDVLMVRDNDTAEYETMRSKIVDRVKDQIQSQFDSVNRLMSGVDSTGLAENPAVVTIREILQNPIDMMILTDPDDLQWFIESPDYAAMFSQAGLQAKAVSSVRCDTDAVSGPLGNFTIEGVEAFVRELATLGTRNVLRPDCADTVICSDVVNSPRREACDAGNRFVTLKQNIMDLANYRCDVFLDPQDMSSDCDPLTMTGVFNSVTRQTEWTGDCLMPDGSMRRKEKYCTLSEFTTYMQAFDTRIDKAMQRMDTAATEVGPAIATTLQQIVEDNILVPIDMVANGVTCGWLGTFYREMVDGLCYQGIFGFRLISQSYNGCAIITLFMVILTYALWRRSIDNVNSVVKTDVVILGTAEGVVPSQPKDIP